MQKDQAPEQMEEALLFFPYAFLQEPVLLSTSLSQVNK